ncbi:hypothetical protein ACFYVL_38700 [Streptomyces sp. NPDC004111]|uniref:hypothetical protein n=1 Tax=Streptomyces sp. NPDC004111 TaxID=3364690 RepID=UPI003678BA07
MRAIGRIAVVGSMVLASAGLSVGSASALYAVCWDADNDAGGVNCSISHEENSWGSVDNVNFQAYGEVLHISDLLANGKGVGAYVEGKWYPFNGTSDDPGVTYNLSFTEGQKITLTSCQTNNGTRYDCHTEYATA